MPWASGRISGKWSVEAGGFAGGVRADQRQLLAGAEHKDYIRNGLQAAEGRALNDIVQSSYPACSPSL